MVYGERGELGKRRNPGLIRFQLLEILQKLRQTRLTKKTVTQRNVQKLKETSPRETKKKREERKRGGGDRGRCSRGGFTQGIKGWGEGGDIRDFGRVKRSFGRSLDYFSRATSQHKALYKPLYLQIRTATRGTFKEED